MEFARAYDPLRALKAAGQLFLRAPLTLGVGALLLALTDVRGTDSGVHFSGGDPRWFWAALGGGTALACGCWGVLLFLANAWLTAGFAGALERVQGGQPERFADLFEARGLFWPLLFARLVHWLAVALAALPFAFLIGVPVAVGEHVDLEWAGALLGGLFGLAYLPLFAYAFLGLALVDEVVVFERRDPIEALKRSWALAEGNRLRLLLAFVVLTLFALLGFLCLFVGALVTLPWSRIAWFESFLALRGAPPR